MNWSFDKDNLLQTMIVPNIMAFLQLLGKIFWKSCYGDTQCTGCALQIQYCAKVMQTNFDEIRGFSWLFGPFQRNFAPSDISAIFLRIFLTPIVLSHAKIQMIIRRARSAAVNFQAIICSPR